MFVEAAFFRFCEALLKISVKRHDWNEDQVRGLFAQSIVDELSSRFIRYPSLRVHMEKKYPISRDVKKSLPVYIYADFAGKNLGLHLSHYGFGPESWIEIKYFSGWDSTKPAPPKTSNIASIVKDFLRLIILTGAKKWYHNRYLIVVFDNEPKRYLAEKSQKYGQREWLRTLLDGKLAEKEIYINFLLEPKHFFNKIGTSKRIKDISLKLYSQAFLPKPDERLFKKEELNSSRQLVYPYLFRIDDFAVNFSDGTIPTPNDKDTYKLCQNLAKSLWG